MSIIWCCCDPVPDTGINLPVVVTLSTSRLPPQVTYSPDKIQPVGIAREDDRALPIALPGIVTIDVAVTDDEAVNVQPIAPAQEPVWGTWNPGGTYSVSGFTDVTQPFAILRPLWVGYIAGFGANLNDPGVLRMSGYCNPGFIYLSQGQAVDYLGLRWTIRGFNDPRGLRRGSATINAYGNLGQGFGNSPPGTQYARATLSAAAIDGATGNNPSIATLDGYTRTAANLTFDNWVNLVDSDNNGFSNWFVSQYRNLKVVELDVTAIAQEIVDRPGWQYGNRMMFLFDEAGTSDFRAAPFNTWGVVADLTNQDPEGGLYEDENGVQWPPGYEGILPGPEVIYEAP